MSVAEEAERKGDTDKMQRALGYAAGISEQAEAYSEKASQGIEADAKAAKEQEKLLQEELIQARKEEREEQETRIEAGAAQDSCAPLVLSSTYFSLLGVMCLSQMVLIFIWFPAFCVVLTIYAVTHP